MAGSFVLRSRPAGTLTTAGGGLHRRRGRFQQATDGEQQVHQA
jgi:hypothetical protein